MSIDTENAKDIRQSMYVRIAVYAYDQSGNYQGMIKAFLKDELLKVIVSLRSDLSKINPTLPESEMEIEALGDQLLAEQLSNLPENSYISFRAGYIESANYDVSETRYFYIDEVDYNDGIIHIHAVDQVHKLDGTLSPIYLGQQWDDNVNNLSYYGGFGYLYSVFYDIIRGSATGLDNNIRNLSHPYNIMHSGLVQYADGHYSTRPENGAVNSIIASGTRREMIAKLMNLCHQDYETGFFYPDYINDAFWLTYVDAGHPKITIQKPSSKFTIYEEDCGNIVNERDVEASEYRFKIRDVLHVNANNLQGMDYVNGTIFKQKAMSLEYSGLVDACMVGIKLDGTDSRGIDGIWQIDWGNEWPEKARPYSGYNWTHGTRANNYYGQYLLDENLPDSDWFIQKYAYYDLASVWNTENADWETPADVWAYWIANGYVNANDTETSATSRGGYFVTTNEREFTVDTGKSGVVIAPDEYIWDGHILAKSWYSDNEKRILPDEGLKALAKRSDEIGSFTWKGDPRMQPRDVFTFVFIEKQLLNENSEALLTENGEELWGGGEEERTIENITMTFEGGGLISEITYRKGIC